ncbi:MAG TPA: hypothetical protein PK339_12435 [Flavitalea sp.]|nr:hypothetical protein [Flavitalea sp.]
MWAFLAAILIVLAIKALWKKDQDYWNGPKPTPEERNKNINMISDHIAQYPDSTDILQKAYPQAARRAHATNRYKQIEELRRTGKMDEATYQVELDKILPLIDISKDLAK